MSLPKIYSVCGTERELDFHKFVTPLNVATSLLKLNGAVLVRLEPGDATRYDFWLIRAGFDPRLKSYGLGGSVGAKWCWLSPVNLRNRGGCWVDLGDKDGFPYMLRDSYENPWTVGVLTIFLELVADELTRLEGE